MRGTFAVLILFLAACASGNKNSRGPAPQPVRLCVQNETEAYGAIVAHAGSTRIDVMPGAETCKPILMAAAAISLTAYTTGGGAHGPLTFATRLLPGTVRCWRWRLTELPGASNDLQPC
jgi:hypothetical protein